MAEHKHNIGGQAVIEGVMMRKEDFYSVAVRLPDGNIKTLKKEVPSKSAFFKKPFIRGVKALVENLKIGYQSLQWSADSIEQAENKEKEEKKPSSVFAFLSILLSVIIAIGLFIIVPNLAVHFMGLIEKDSPLIYNLIAGAIRLFIFFAYILAISFIKDVKRLFQYHGAEHKTIHAFEAGKELSYENIKPYPTLHKRCGTSFLFLLIFVGILFFSIVPPILLKIIPGFASWGLISRKVVIIVSHLILIPFLASFSYEVLRVTAKNNIIGKTLILLAYPGLFFQKITTKEPDEKQVEVAVESLRVLLEDASKEEVVA